MDTHSTFIQPLQLSSEKSLQTRVENRTIYFLNHCELNIYETFEVAESVNLKFNDFLVTSMIRGKKIMHLYDDPGFEYLPGQTVVVPPKVALKIDFPEASLENPTQCLALAIDQTKIDNTIQFLNERYPKEGNSNTWHLDYQNYFFYNNPELATTINKLMKECMSTSITKDVLADLTLQELLIRIIQTQTTQTINNISNIMTHLPIAEVVSFIRLHIKENIDLKVLGKKFCMSSASMYRLFKRELGVSPIEFILTEKIKCAKTLLKNREIHINEVSHLSGFDDCNYFIRLFKKTEGITPKQFQLLHII